MPEKESPVLHPWMYSFLPANEEFYLLGYCKNCNTSFSMLVPHDKTASGVRTPRMTEMGIPKIGCQVPSYLPTN